jgi:ubiquinone/menaquinone biosynthesis C-methylase UbiE
VIEKLEILPVSLLEGERQTIRELQELASRLKLEFGWHYLLDLSWIIRQLGEIQGKSVIDAGAGTGIMQWYLAGRGAQVISVDRESRAKLPSRFRRRFKVSGLRQDDLVESSPGIGENQTKNLRPFKLLASDVLDRLNYQLNEKRSNAGSQETGQVVIYNQNLTELLDISDDSMDAIIAVSSLEHNSPDDLTKVVRELMRVLKPGCALVATLGAASDADWYHEPSKGWCYSEETLRRIFAISSETSSNYAQYVQLFEQLRTNEELQNNLATFYFRSGDNGMPWGKWDPQYQPVGICKVKQETLVGEQQRTR